MNRYCVRSARHSPDGLAPVTMAARQPWLLITAGSWLTKLLLKASIAAPRNSSALLETVWK